jgi:SulP family sulfate permease
VLDSYFPSESESTTNRDIEGLRHDIIEEVSEPASPESGPSDKSTSVLTNLLRRSPPSSSPPIDDEDQRDGISHGVEGHQPNGSQGRLIITSNGVEVDCSERTPLLGKDTTFETHHPDWIRGQQDIEGQSVRRKASWPKLRNIVSWPREKGYDLAVTVFTPKRWNRKAILQAAVSPVVYFPAVILGTLLNNLDALSYGLSWIPIRDWNCADFFLQERFSSLLDTQYSQILPLPGYLCFMSAPSSLSWYFLAEVVNSKVALGQKW